MATKVRLRQYAITCAHGKTLRRFKEVSDRRAADFLIAFMEKRPRIKDALLYVFRKGKKKWVYLTKGMRFA